MNQIDEETVESKETDYIRKNFQNLFTAEENNFEDNKQKIQDCFFEQFTENFIIPNKDEIPALFRYSPADYYNIRNLETETLMLSSIGNMNDIFEGLSGEVDNEVIASLDELKDIAFIKCFTEQKNDFLMWSHYGDDYAGMCVEYDFSNLSDDILYHLFPVIYSNKRYRSQTLGNAVRDLYELKKANKEDYYPDLYESLLDIMALFLRKPLSWSIENEWRLVATYPQIYNSPGDFYDLEKNDKCPLFALNDKIISVKNCIKSVYIGPRMLNTQREHIKEICAKLNGVTVHELVISKTDYILEEKNDVLKSK